MLTFGYFCATIPHEFGADPSSPLFSSDSLCPPQSISCSPPNVQTFQLARLPTSFSSNSFRFRSYGQLRP